MVVSRHGDQEKEGSGGRGALRGRSCGTGVQRGPAGASRWHSSATPMGGMGRGVGTGHSQTRPLSMARARAPYTGQSASSLCAWELQPRNVDKDGWPTNRHSHKLVPLLPASLVESQCQCLHRLRRKYEAVSHSISIHLNVFIVSLLCSCLPSKKRANQRGRERKK